jgi:D-3-phosphoglycerate dehydrogenase / 2-oxoglutarate reductase
MNDVRTPTMRVLVSDSLEQGCIDLLKAEGFEVENAPGTKPQRLLEIIGDYDALVVRSATKVNADVVARAVRLRVIGRAGTGVDNIDVDAATRRGILVMNTPGGNTISTAEHTVSMLLSLARNIPQANMSLVRGEWEKKKYVGTEVFEKTIGVIGLGKIGREVAARCRALGMQVLGFDPVLGVDVAGRLQIQLVALPELYRRSDFITVHTPLNGETRGLLNDTTITLCKRGVRLINCARGGIIDEQALLRALESGQVGGAALDVFEIEPPAGNPLLKHERVIATPHLGASTEEAQEKVAVQIAHQVADVLKGRGYVGIVNSPAIQLGMTEEIRPYMELAEKMGSFAGQTLTSALQSLTLTVTGDLLVGSIDLLRAGLLKGVLSRAVPDPVNLINAPLIASEMGIRVNEVKEEERGRFSMLVRLQCSSAGGKREVSGTVFGASTIRFVSLDGFPCEVRPEGFLLAYRNLDRPGVLASVSAILAAQRVNIAGVSLGRSAVGGDALTIMNIDNAIPKAGLEELHRLQGVTDLNFITFD